MNQNIKSFLEIFNFLDLEENEKKLLNNLEIISVKSHKDKKGLEIIVSSLNNIEDELKSNIEKQIETNFKDVNIVKLKGKKISNNDINDIKNDWQKVVKELGKLSPICKQILKGAKTKFENNNIHIKLQKSSAEYLSTLGFETKIEDIISKCYQVKTKVIITGEQFSEEQIKTYEEEILKEQEELLRRASKQIAATKTETSQNKSKNQNNNETKKSYGKGKKENSDVILGREIKGDIISLDKIDVESYNPIVRGKIFRFEEREIKGDRFIVSFDITDKTNSITCKFFIKKKSYEDGVKGELKEGKYVKVQGAVQYDSFSKEIVIMTKNIMKQSAPPKKMDVADNKRIELHLHTQMSEMDAVVSVQDAVNRAKEWGHKAIAITDHGVLQSFPEAMHAAEGSGVKVLYGVEGYLVDNLTNIAWCCKEEETFNNTFIVFDIETTGLKAGRDKITEIGAVKIVNGEIIDRYSTFVNPKVPIPKKITKLTNITDDMVRDARIIDEVLPEFLNFVGDGILVAHNAKFDVGFIRYESNRLGYDLNNTILDTLGLSRALLKDIKNNKLDTVCEYFDVKLEGHHRAVNDAEATALVFLKFIELLEDEKITKVKDVNLLGDNSDIKMLPTYHVIIIAKNHDGIVALNKLVSNSHVKYFKKRPRIPKSELEELRENLIIGSACEAGELFKAIIDKKPENEIERLAKFYDYLEIQPIGNNNFLIESPRYTNINSKVDLEDINKKIIELGKKLNKLVVATGDVHFLNKEDEIYRRIIMKGKGFDDADNQPPLYYRTTDEMLDEFLYLDEKQRYEVVVENPNKIADMIEETNPISPDECFPNFDGADDELRNTCYDCAKRMYGENLPEIVGKRLEKELKAIISSGYATLYLIAQKLVLKSLEDGYLVGSRGSVGSSFVATMADITEVNPLPPHYLCPKCKYCDFDSEEPKKALAAGNSGCDLPDAKCPVCGADLGKEGHDIPFETFLGFYGDKVPDIDLNFSGEYQSTTHEYTESIFGKGKAFRAGTIGTLADKTAYGYIYKYYEEKGIPIRKAEINRLVKGCVGIKRTTGQHPGGIVVLPKDKEIYEFCAIQWPANDDTAALETTHIDYHSIEHNLLKLDILGHDDPTMIRRLEDITGIKAKDIPFDEKKVLSLWQNTGALGITPDDIGGCKLGTLGIPEMGTNFLLQVIEETKPQTFSDLVRISGLTHGTDVYLDNAQTLIREGKADITNVISTRDSIMLYLIQAGLEKGVAFKIMENVRKGKVAKGKVDFTEHEKMMKECNVPDWYIWSCKRIKYMFPKAHAVAYVMMAFRIAYFKIYYPLAYYTAYFSIRASDFDYELMCHGKDELNRNMDEYKEKIIKNEASKKEKDTYEDMKIVREMYARGFEFEPIDIYTAKAKKFEIVNGKIMPSLVSIAGLGESVAIKFEKNTSEFISLEDVKKKTKSSNTLIEKLVNNKILVGLPETSQLSLFM